MQSLRQPLITFCRMANAVSSPFREEDERRCLLFALHRESFPEIVSVIGTGASQTLTEAAPLLDFSNQEHGTRRRKARYQGQVGQTGVLAAKYPKVSSPATMESDSRKWT